MNTWNLCCESVTQDLMFFLPLTHANWVNPLKCLLNQSWGHMDSWKHFVIIFVQFISYAETILANVNKLMQDHFTFFNWVTFVCIANNLYRLAKNTRWKYWKIKYYFTFYQYLLSYISCSRTLSRIILKYTKRAVSIIIIIIIGY